MPAPCICWQKLSRGPLLSDCWQLSSILGSCVFVVLQDWCLNQLGTGCTICKLKQLQPSNRCSSFDMLSICRAWFCDLPCSVLQL